MRMGHGRRERFLARAFVLGAGVLIATTLAPRCGAAADLEKVLYSSCAQGGANCIDGAAPQAGLLMDAPGHLYGTAPQGGAHGQGTVFELTPNAAKTVWTHKVLYSFCAQGGFHCTDGAKPVAGLIMDAAGNLYGTTEGKSPEDTSGPRVRLASAKVERAGALPP